jgi:cytochrome bd-type quinol oxidase subunit 2
MGFQDVFLLLHPAIAILVVFPLLGIVVHRAMQVRSRRLQTTPNQKNQIPPSVGQEHVQIGQWLSLSVVGVTLVAFAHDILSNAIENQIWQKNPFLMLFVVLLFAATVSSLWLLSRARQPLGRALFATLTGMGLVILGCQDGVYRQTEKWYVSHYYYGLVASLLMIFSLAIVQNIYKDRKNHWRKVHISLNAIVLFLFLGQGITGSQALLEIPLNWQKAYVQQLYEQHCDVHPCAVQENAAVVP